MKSLIFIGSIFLLLSCSTGKKEEGTREQANFIIKEFVSERLKSPSTADFEFDLGVEHIGIHRHDKKYKAESYVDSQNSFGGIVRTNFICIVEYIDKDKKWVLEKLEFINN